MRWQRSANRAWFGFLCCPDHHTMFRLCGSNLRPCLRLVSRWISSISPSICRRTSLGSRLWRVRWWPRRPMPMRRRSSPSRKDGRTNARAIGGGCRGTRWGLSVDPFGCHGGSPLPHLRSTPCLSHPLSLHRSSNHLEGWVERTDPPRRTVHRKHPCHETKRNDVEERTGRCTNQCQRNDTPRECVVPTTGTWSWIDGSRMPSHGGRIGRMIVRNDAETKRWNRSTRRKKARKHEGPSMPLFDRAPHHAPIPSHERWKWTRPMRRCPGTSTEHDDTASSRASTRTVHDESCPIDAPGRFLSTPTIGWNTCPCPQRTDLATGTVDSRMVERST
mmetsp:Transcript_9302/g.56652  ORF Transcript_9302/g.56652 Transcript_9302/m.56652 type:complete len:332 (+) Transcript_9302:2122-3117(+)